MGAWSTRIFDNDVTMDILAEYKILLGYGISPEETYRKISDYFAKDFIGKEDEDDYWLGIAYFQWRNGILLEEVKENALRCMNDENYLERWKHSGEKVYQNRKKVLEEFKDKLLHEVRPTKKKFPKCPSYYREKTDWEIGDLIAYKITKKPFERSYHDEIADKVSVMEHKLFEKYFLLRVIDIEKHPISHILPELDYSSESIVMVYDWFGEEIPSKEVVKDLKFKPLVAMLHEINFDASGKLLEKPDFVKLLVVGVYFSKESGNLQVCETVVLENDPSYICSKPELYMKHPCLQDFISPSHLNYMLAETYTDFDYKEKFWE